MREAIADITILGGGPTGLYAAFFAGMRQRSVRIIDSLPELGGQLTALYPEKYIYDVGGFPKVLARDLGRALVEQALQFSPEVVLGEEIVGLDRNGRGLCLEGRRGRYPTRALILAVGKGAMNPVKLECPGYDEFLGRGVDHTVRRPEDYQGKRVVVVGGGDSAVDWALALHPLARRVVLVHRRDTFRAFERSVELLREAEAMGRLEVRTFHEVEEIRGRERVETVVLKENQTGGRSLVEAEAVVACLGFKPDLGPLRSWGVRLEKNRVAVNHRMETNLEGVYAAGDIVAYEGKLDLIATGFAEAAIAVNNAVHFVDPTARVNPGHSTNLKIFQERKGH